MDARDRKEFSACFALMCEVFEPDIDANRLKLLRDIYFETLKAFSIAEVREAMTTIMKTRVYNKLPKPAEIYNAVYGSDDDRALFAFVSVVKAIKCVGPYNDVQFSDPVIHTTINMIGGWQRINEVTDKELKWMEKDFTSAYRIASKQEAHPLRLAGSNSIHNAASGYDIPPMIGYVDSAPNVLPTIRADERPKEIADDSSAGNARVKALLSQALQGK